MRIIKFIKKTATLSLIALITIGANGCKKYLDKKQNSKLITPSTLYDMQALLDDDGLINTLVSPSFGETSADDYFVLDDYYNSQKQNFQSYYIWHPYFDPTNDGANDWRSCYAPVYVANLVLERIKTIKQTSNNSIVWNNIKGSALFIRSYFFLELLWNYSKAYDSTSSDKDWGIALRMTSDFNVLSVRATNSQCYNQVISDTKEAIGLLPDYPQVLTRPSKAAAYGLLARCYLSMRDYKQALLYSDSCLQLNHQLMDYNNDDEISAALPDPFNIFNKETVFFMMMNNNYKLFRSTYGYSRIDTTLYASYNDNDLRKSLFFEDYNDGYHIFDGSYCGTDGFYFSGISTDEMYLIRSESYIRGGQLQKGLNDLNALLITRYKTGTFVPFVTSSTNTALDTVLQERRKELVMRGLRWMDIKRLNKEGRNIVLKRIVDGQLYTLMPNANYYALPIPEDIIQLTGMPQNAP